MASRPSITPNAMLPPRSEVGVIGWLHTNLFSNWYNAALTLVSAAVLVVALWFGLKWVLFEADWTVIAKLGGRFIIARYNTESACPGQNCLWRPQISLLMVMVVLGAAWGLKGNAVARNVAWLAAGVSAAFAFLPYSFETMGWDVRLLLLATPPAMVLGWALARFTPLGTASRITMLGVAVFSLTVLLLAWSARGAGLAARFGGLLGRLDAEPDTGRGGHYPQSAHRRCPGPGTTQQPSGGEGPVRFLHRSVPGGATDYPALHVSNPGAPGFPEDMPQNSLFRAAVVITLFSSAYMAENIRGGLQALHPGQAEAARALGLPGWQTTMLISLPQAIRNVIPAIVGQFIGLFKDTSLVYIIGMLDVVAIGRSFIQSNPEYLANARELFVFLALVFWVFTFGMSYVSGKVEEHLGVGRR